jgi:hypothetical protein
MIYVYSIDGTAAFSQFVHTGGKSQK